MKKYLIYDRTNEPDIIFLETLDDVEEYKKENIDYYKKSLECWKEHPDWCGEEHIKELEETIKNYDDIIKIYEVKEIRKEGK